MWTWLLRIETFVTLGGRKLGFDPGNSVRCEYFISCPHRWSWWCSRGNQGSAKQSNSSSSWSEQRRPSVRSAILWANPWCVRPGRPPSLALISLLDGKLCRIEVQAVSVSLPTSSISACLLVRLHSSPNYGQLEKPSCCWRQWELRHRELLKLCVLYMREERSVKKIRMPLFHFLNDEASLYLWTRLE